MSSTENTSPPMADHANSAAAHSSPGRNKKKRIRHWTAEERAAHRVFERSRREAFKERLLTLAGLIPSLRSTEPNRLSKHVVIDQSVALHKTEQKKITESLQRIDRLVAERDNLLSELNTWRLNAGLKAHKAQGTADDAESTSTPGLDEGRTSMMRASVSSIATNNEHGGVGGGSMNMEEEASFVAAEQDLTAEAAMAPTAEPDLPPTPMDMSIAWISPEMDFTIPDSLTLANDFDADTPTRSPCYTHLPMPYDIATNNLGDESLRFNPTAMHVADPSSFSNNDTYIYTG